MRTVWQRLADRAVALGQKLSWPATTNDPNLRIMSGARSLQRSHADGGRYILVLPNGDDEVRLVSSAGAPADLRPWSDDRRRLGVSVERIVLRTAEGQLDLPLDHPDLSQGWWAVERDGTTMRRWTNGDAMLPLPPFAGPAILEIRASAGGMAYLASRRHECRAA